MAKKIARILLRGAPCVVLGAVIWAAGWLACINVQAMAVTPAERTPLLARGATISRASDQPYSRVSLKQPPPADEKRQTQSQQSSSEPKRGNVHG